MSPFCRQRNWDPKSFKVLASCPRVCSKNLKERDLYFLLLGYVIIIIKCALCNNSYFISDSNIYTSETVCRRLDLQIVRVQETSSNADAEFSQRFLITRPLKHAGRLMARGLSGHPKYRNRFFLELHDAPEISTMNTV